MVYEHKLIRHKSVSKEGQDKESIESGYYTALRNHTKDVQ